MASFGACYYNSQYALRTVRQNIVNVFQESNIPNTPFTRKL